ncbi:DinB family protein [Blastococcus montanus]|uniref:DinB family protein n=1 Tax=Blastococcus montanus TaxID=3144973 RepID=UPI003208D045
MTGTDRHGRPYPPVDGDEVATLLGFLDHHRATLAWKCAGLDADALRVPVAASSITLGGLLKHMALVEALWFSLWLHGRSPGDPWVAVDWDADPDWAWRSAAGDSPEELRGLWEAAVARSRDLVAEALADGGLTRQAVVAPWPPDDVRPTLRWILLHMVEEYARHNGHADLIRESIDGQVGD